MRRKRFDYTQAVKLVQDKAATTGMVARKDLSNALEVDTLSAPGFDRLSTLRNKAKKVGIRIARYSASKDAYMLVCEEATVPSADGQISLMRTTDDATESLQALMRDNQALFLDNEELKAKISAMQVLVSAAEETTRMLHELQAKYDNLLSVTSGLAKLAGITA